MVCAFRHFKTYLRKEFRDASSRKASAYIGEGIGDDALQKIYIPDVIWGMVELGYRSPDDFDFTFEYERKTSKAKNSKGGKIKLVSFKNFCPYEIDLED